MKLLAINFGGLGDEVLFLPTLKSIKLANPTWEITLLTEPRGRAIKQLSKVIDQNIVFDIKKQLKPKDYLDLILLIRKGNYDIVLSSGASSRVSILLFLTGIPKRIGYDGGSLSKMLLTNPVPLKRDQYAAWMYHDLVRGLGIDLAASAPQIDLEEESLAKMRLLLAEKRNNRMTPLVLIHPGMSKLALNKGIIKTWSSSNWSELIRRLKKENYDVLLCGGPDDNDTISNIVRNLTSEEASPGKLINAVGKTASIQDLAALMQLADLIVCVDSAPMHMALALRRRLVALFGPTDPEKLFLASEHAIAIRDPNAELVDHNFQLKSTAGANKNGSADSMSQSEPSVQIPLDTVFQTVMDQLSRVTSRGS
jgi:ADP-heptose:LPS heptosyltransferase